MLAKLTSKNQLTLPKTIITKIGAVEYFDVEAADGRIVLTPVNPRLGDSVREKLAALGITGEDITDAINHARGK